MCAPLGKPLYISTPTPESEEMATYEYRLGFRFVVNPCSVDPGRERPTDTPTKKSRTIGNHGTYLEVRHKNTP